MKIALASDLHLEFGDLRIYNTDSADVLVLAGDIVLAEDLHDHPPPPVPYTPEQRKTLGKRQLKAQEYRDFISHCASEFPHVVAIAGNHEFYHGRWNASIDHLYEAYSAHSNVHFLECDEFELDDVVFLGGTLWTDLNKGNPVTIGFIQGSMNDYNLIRDDTKGYSKLHPSKTISRHRHTIQYFDRQIKQHNDKRIVVVSHMAPSHLSIIEQYKNSFDNPAYYSDLSEFILDHPQIKLWCHGHMHTPFDYLIGDTRVVCNPRGYVNVERASQEVDPYLPIVIEV